MGMLAAIVDVDQLLEVAWVSLAAGVGVTTVFSLVILGGARSAEARREGRDGAALAYGTLAAVALAAFAAIVVVGVIIMLRK
jgi:hypothetical protein